MTSRPALSRPPQPAGQDETGAAAKPVPSLPLLDGGPTHRLMLRIGLAKRRTPKLVRGALLLAVVAWLPLLVLSALRGLAVGGVPVPFLYDFAAHVRLLFAVPLLVVAEVVIGPRFIAAAAHFIQSGLVAEEDRGRFEEAVEEALRLRDSAFLEVAVLLLAYVGSFLALGLQLFSGASTWDVLTTNRGPVLTRAGIWNVFVSIPLFQFLLFRWCMRLLIWWRFLSRIARLDLRLVASHPDRAGGLGFLGGAHRPLGVIAAAAGAVLSGRYCTEILFQGGSISTLKGPVAGFVAVIVIVFLGPLLVFAPRMLAAKKKAALEYSALALRYTSGFERKWLQGGAGDEELLGTGDIQSLADLANSFEVVKGMRMVPFGWTDVTSLVAWALIPMAPVLATVMPVEEVVKTVLKILG